MGGVFEYKRSGLIDGYGTSAGGGVRLLAAMQGKRIESGFPIQSCLLIEVVLPAEFRAKFRSIIVARNQATVVAGTPRNCSSKSFNLGQIKALSGIRPWSAPMVFSPLPVMARTMDSSGFRRSE